MQHVADYAIYLIDENGFVTTWNAGAERIKGYKPDEIIGAHFSRFFTPEDRAAGLPERALATARREGRFESEGWRVKRDGTRFWASAVLDVVHDEAGAFIGYAKITRDITERHAAQQALLESERRFRLLVDGVSDYAIYMLDPSGVIVNWNSGARRIKGYEADEVVGRHFSMFFRPEDRAAGLPAQILETAAREGRYEAEARRVRKDGHVFWASVVLDAIRDQDGDLIGYAKVTRDISERRAAQHALRESERQFTLLVSSVTDYSIFMLDPNGIVTSWNAGAQRIKGYLADEIIGQHFSRFHTDADRRSGLPAKALHQAATEGKFETEGWRVRKSGEMFWAHVVIDPIRDDQGQLVGYAKITRDISEKKKAEANLAEAQKQLAQSQKMDALGQLTGGVAHDFNNLLAIISGQSQILKRRHGEDAAIADIAESILTAVSRGAALTRQLLTFARRQPANPENVQFAQQLANLRPMLASAVSESIRINSTAPPNLWTIFVDPNELELSIVNLVVNARDAMPAGGEVKIIAENVVVDEGDLRDALAGDFVVISVIDQGCGIPADILPRIFDPFFTTKMHKGTGLGLAQVFGFARSSGGDVRVLSEVGKGTRISLYLPRSASVVPAAAPHEKAPMASAGDRILVVEDNPDVGAVTRAMLEDLGYSVHQTSNADLAVAALDAGLEIDLVISDIVMAGSIDGLGLARKLQRDRPDLPVLLVTGFSSSIAEADAVFPVLRKPFQIAELARAVSNLLTKIRSDNVVPIKRRRVETGKG